MQSSSNGIVETLPPPINILHWSKSNLLLDHGKDELQHFPEKLFQFGQCKQDLSLTKRERRRLDRKNTKLPPIENKKKGKNKPRGATRHSNPLHLATLRGEHDLMNILIKGNAVKIDSRDGNAATSLHIATEQNDLKAVEILVDAGASLDLNDYETALHCAVRMDHTEIVRYLIRKGASLSINNLDSINAFDLSMRKIVGNEKFANGILRPITTQKETIDYDGSKKYVIQQKYEKMRTMSTWDHGEKLLHDMKNKREKRVGAQKLSRLVLKENLNQAKAMIGEFGAGCVKADPDDYGRSALTYAAMYSNPSTVKWLVKEAGAKPSAKDVEQADGRSKIFLSTWPEQMQQEMYRKQKQTLDNYNHATILRSYEANAKAGLHFLRSFLSSGKVRYGHNFKSKIIMSLRALEKCPLGPADDFFELGRILRDLLPNSWGSEAWNVFQDALIAARRKEGGIVGGGDRLHRLKQQGNQGEILRVGQMRRVWKRRNDKENRQRHYSTSLSSLDGGRYGQWGRKFVPPPPPRDYSGLITGARYEKEYVPGI
jgi:ankyrin repeat protein